MFILLLIAGILGTIQCCAQQDSNKICLTYPQFDFYADALVERNGLRSDTAILNKQIIEQDKIINYQSKQIEKHEEISNTQKSLIALKTKENSEIKLDLDRVNKKLHRSKKTVLILGITSAVLGIIILVK